ncbi:hypothetical protein ES708_30331 [subsurface metagenome]
MPLSDAPSRAKRIVRDNDTLISTVRPNLEHYAHVKRVKPNTIASTGFAVVTTKNIDPRYLYYYLTTKPFTAYLSQIADSHTSAYPAINPDVIEMAELLLPPASEQSAIATILGALDDKMNQTMEGMTQALFKNWFVDFEPFRDKGMEDSLLGPMPRGWSTKPLDEIADFINGLALQKYPPEGDDYLPVIKIVELRRGVNESSGKASLNIDNAYIVEDGDILFSWSGSLEVCIWCGGRGALNQHLFKVTSPSYPKWFYYHWTKYHLPEFQAIAAGKATTMGHIQRYHLSSAFVAIPPKDVLETMDGVMAPVVERITHNNLESRMLAVIRDTLLPKLLSGEIRVKDAEKFVEKAI